MELGDDEIEALALHKLQRQVIRVALPAGVGEIHNRFGNRILDRPPQRRRRVVAEAGRDKHVARIGPCSARADVVGVECRCRSTDGAEATARFQTESGETLDLRMSPKAVEECASCWTTANLRNASALIAPGMPAAAATVSPAFGATHVMMTLNVGGVGETRFILEHTDAVVLAAQLIDAAKAANDRLDNPPN